MSASPRKRKLDRERLRQGLRAVQRKRLKHECADQLMLALGDQLTGADLMDTRRGIRDPFTRAKWKLRAKWIALALFMAWLFRIIFFSV